MYRRRVGARRRSRGGLTALIPREGQMLERQLQAETVMQMSGTKLWTYLQSVRRHASPITAR